MNPYVIPWMDDDLEVFRDTVVRFIETEMVPHDVRWRDASQKLAQWVIDNTSDARGAGGFTGGVVGFDASPQKLMWKSTEHNIDLVALFEGLARAGAKGDWRKHADNARRFVD